MMKQGPLSGQVVGGKYLLGELLGKGGFGAVYKATNQMLARPQAVKVLLEEHFSDVKFRDRFLREARTLAALDHANIVHVDDIGMEGNLIYLVMAYISGGTLQEVMKARPGPLELDQTTRYLEQICSALGYAHAQGVVHLDLKPLNLLIHHDSRLLLSDFGLAHLMEQGAIEGGTSLQFGSPLYMAPEHFDGRPEQRSDLYALGVILYQMLTGRHPFEASTPAAVMRKHLTEPPPPLRTARPDLPVALDAVIAKALAKQPEQRYSRAGELLFDFRAGLGGQALQFAGLDEPTRLSQASQDTTLRAKNPPVSPAGPTLTEVGQAVPPPISQSNDPPPPPPGFLSSGVPRPVPAATEPGKVKLWTQGFTRLFVVMALLGGVATFYGVKILLANFADINYFGYDFAGIDWVVLLVLCAIAAICLVGLRFVRSKLLRAGLLLQIGSIAGRFILFANTQRLYQGRIESFFFDPWNNVYLPLLLTALNAASLVVISYGIARWRRVQDVGLTMLQVTVSGIVSYLLLIPIIPSDGSSSPLDQIGESLFLLWITVAATLFAASVFLLRPACWKQRPVVTSLLGLGTVLFVFQAPGANIFLALRFPFDLIYFQTSYSVWFLSWLLSLLGFLLLIQTERVRKRAQQPAPAPAAVGQKLP